MIKFIRRIERKAITALYRKCKKTKERLIREKKKREEEARLQWLQRVFDTTRDDIPYLIEREIWFEPEIS